MFDTKGELPRCYSLCFGNEAHIFQDFNLTMKYVCYSLCFNKNGVYETKLTPVRHAFNKYEFDNTNFLSYNLYIVHPIVGQESWKAVPHISRYRWCCARKEKIQRVPPL
jgi:hypothetical protein